MKFKKFALRGLIVLAVTVALCMFFARTVQTITTPKVQLVTATTGRLEQKISLKGEVYFPKTEEIFVEDAKKTSVTVNRIYVREGHYVNAGDVIFTATAPTYDEDMKKLQEDYDAKAQALIDLDIANRKLSKESRQNELYDAMIQAQDKLSKVTYQSRYAALAAGVTLSGEVTEWKKQLAAVKDAPQEVKTAVDQAVAAKSAFDTARTAFFEVYENRKLRVSDDVFKYIKERNDTIKAMDELSEDMVALDVRVNGLKEVKAPRAGYVVSLGIAEGDTYDGSKAAYTMNDPETPPVLRASMEGIERTISDGTKAEIPSDTYGTEKTTVEKTVREADGTKYLYITLPESMTQDGSSAVRQAVSAGGVDINITYRAKQSSTLLPPSAVRNEGEGSDYVYLISQNYGGFMNASSMKVVKTKVTVLERSDKAVSIAEDLSYQQVADREDRALSDGQTVMEYVN